MNKGAVLLVTIFLLSPCIAFSATTFVIQETEKISLQPEASDPDADRLLTTYAEPLDENGEWQTNYGDAGEYDSAITVSDGTTNVSQEILIIVEKKEEKPVIDSFAPRQEFLAVKEGQAVGFSIEASDLNNDWLSYEWLLDGEKTGESNKFSYETAYDDAGNHKVSVRVSDGSSGAGREWGVNVENVDVEALLNGISDIVANENEIIRLDIPDFKKYGLSYSISDPVGMKNEWKTSYSDAGTYEVEVHAEGKGFNENKNVKITINDLDRLPLFESIGNRVVNENDEVKIILNANDPDGDEITYSASGMPEGASLDGNVFAWKTSYDTVKKEGFVDKVVDKFRALGKSFYVQFAASSKDKKIIQNVIITVKDINRVPVLEDFEPITISEKDTLKIAPKAYDPDGDKISLSYSGFIGKDTFKSGYDDAGTYYAKVTASDGLLETSKFVQINIMQSNRAPVFGKMPDTSAREGDSIAFILNANDPDGDELEYSMDNAPPGASIKGNAFLWVPGFDVAGRKEKKKFDIVFVVSDGKAETRQIAEIEIADKNRAPRIIDATRSVSARVNEPVLMSVKAADDDQDALTYTWDFGLVDKYKAADRHQRIFTSRGIKTVKVIVSDGIDEAEQVINVNVV